MEIQYYEMLLRQKGTLPLTTAMEQKFFKTCHSFGRKKVIIKAPIFSLFCMLVISLYYCIINGIYTP